MADAEIIGSTEEKARRFTATDWQQAAQYIADEYNRRKQARSEREKLWDEVDRQVAMRPRPRGIDPSGRRDPALQWKAELELPLQSNALEVLTADARRLLFPENGDWFNANAMMSDDYLRRVDYSALIAGDENEVPSQINQENANKLVEGWLNYYAACQGHGSQSTFYDEWDRFNAGAFKYGTGVGRARMVRRSTGTYDKDAGAKQDIEWIPAFLGKSIRNVYLDDAEHARAAEGIMTQPAIIARGWIHVRDLQKAASSGKTDETDPNGGWIAKATIGLEGNNDGYVEWLEYEGDLILPRSTTDSALLPGVLVTIALGSGGPTVVRYRKMRFSECSWIVQPYHMEGMDPYGAAPLVKGMPVQAAASLSFCQMIDNGELNCAPPISYDKDDPFYAAAGPMIAPNALWPTTGQISPQQIGNMQGNLVVFQALLSQYADTLGIMPARLGAQTISHTTATAKQIELNQGASRTVDYVETLKANGMTKWLNIAFQMGKEYIGDKKIDCFIREYGGWVTITKDALPDKAAFQVLGANAPSDERESIIKKANALQLAMQVDAASVQMGGKPLNYDEIKRTILREAFPDVDKLMGVADAAAQPGVPGGAASGPSSANALTLYPNTAGQALAG